MDFGAFVAYCSSHGLPPETLGRAGLWTALFLAGLGGSAAHCAPMCGPLVLAQAGARLAAVPAARLCAASCVRSGFLVPYHLGRLTTYAALGAAVAGLGGGLSRLPWFRDASAMLLATAAMLFLWQGLKRFLPGAAASGRLAKGLARLSARLAGASWPQRLAQGVLLGFLPCGFLYGALAGAAGAASPAAGALAMLAFGLGTVPMLAAIGIAGHAMLARLSRFAAIAAPAVMLVNAAMLFALAWHRAAG